MAFVHTSGVLNICKKSVVSLTFSHRNRNISLSSISCACNRSRSYISDRNRKFNQHILCIPCKELFTVEEMTKYGKTSGYCTWSKEIVQNRFLNFQKSHDMKEQDAEIGINEIMLSKDKEQKVKQNETFQNGRKERRIGISEDEQRKLVRQRPNQPPDAQVLRVTIIGSPNAGKSTLANQILQWRYSSVSSKVHTTRHKSIGVLTEGNTQIIFLDTPGMITPQKRKKHNLDLSFLTDPHSTLYSADVILVVVDVSTIWNRSRLDKEILKALYLHKDKRIVLILNKVDLFEKPLELLHTTRILTEGKIAGSSKWYQKQQPPKKAKNFNMTDKEFLELFKRVEEGKVSGNAEDCTEGEDGLKDIRLMVAMGMELEAEDNEKWMRYYNKQLNKIGKQINGKKGFDGFHKVFHMSALNNAGVEDLKTYLIDSAKPGNWEYNESVITDLSPIEMAKMCVWEKLLDNLPAEIPYRIDIKPTLWLIDEEGTLRASFSLLCHRKREASALLVNKQLMRKIASEAKQELMNTFRTETTLQLVVKFLYERKFRR